MISQNYSTSFTVDQTPEQVYATINNVRAWWTGDIEGNTDTVGEVFSYRSGNDHYSKHEIVELVPNQKIVWRVVESELNFVDEKNEWTGTEVTFEITQKDGQTEVHFSHLGLVPDFECFEACSNAWGYYINGSLRKLITAQEAPLP